MPLNAPVEITAPPLVAARRGLLSASTRRDMSPRLAGGAEWLPEQCGRPGIAPDPCDPEADDKVWATQADIESASPLTVYGSWTCLLPGFEVGEAEERATRHLTQGEQRTVEYAMWTGAGGMRPYLADPGTVTLTAVTSAVDALSALEGWLAENYPGVGTIHVPRAAVPYLVESTLIRVVGDGLETYLGTRVAAGAGYDEANSSPDTPPVDPEDPPTPGTPAAAGSWWLYATGAVVLYQGDLLPRGGPAGGYDVSSNVIMALAERLWLAQWDCGAAAVLMTP